LDDPGAPVDDMRTMEHCQELIDEAQLHANTKQQLKNVSRE
jgi:hypothetical protein